MRQSLPALRALATTLRMSHGDRNWPFLMLTGLPWRATFWMKSVCRHRNAGVCSTSATAATSASGVYSCTSVSTGTPIWLLTVSRIFNPFRQAGAAIALVRGAVGLVERGFVDERDAQPPGDVLEPAGGIQRQLLGFDHAGTGDQEQGSVQADLETTQLHHDVTLPSWRSRRCRIAASTNPRNNGCPARGVEVNSGWNWQPRNQG